MTGVVSIAVAPVSEQAFDWQRDPLAVGGMAEVFSARDRRLPREVILKRPRTYGVDGRPLTPELMAEFRSRLESEALILAKLQHPAIVTIHELGRSREGAPFCVLERVEGRALRDVLVELAEAEEVDGRPRTRARIELLTNLLAVAEALACAHDHGIVHRDVTPNNILIGPRGEATLIDWGLAKDLGEEARRGDGAAEPVLPAAPVADGSATIVAGTPPYVPLEQAMGQAAHPSFDVYSFGATLYHVVAGRPPFGDESPAAYLARLVHGERPPPVAPRDPELSGIIDRAMAARSEDRFTAAELLRALKEYLTGDLVFSHRYSLTGRAGRWIRKHRGRAALLAAIAAAAALFAIGWVIVERRAERAGRQAAEAKSEAAEARSRAAAQVASAEARSASAERERARAIGTVSLKEAEARAARDEAEQADKNSQAYKQLQEIAERKQHDADEARATADLLAHAAEQRAADARRAAEAAQADAEATRREAQEAVSAMERERDEAVALRLQADTERERARAALVVAESERDQSRAAQRQAAAERDMLRERLRLLERELGRDLSGESGRSGTQP